MGFQSEVVGKKGSCVVTTKSKFTDISIKSGSNDRLILTRGTAFFKASTPEFSGSPMWLASGTRMRPPQSGLVQIALP
jgi:hypothetical protein